MNLTEWTQAYISYLNSFRNNLISREVKENVFVCEYKDKGKIIYVVHENLNEFDKKDIKENSVLVCLNTKVNLNYLIENWNNYIKFRTLKIIFSNPNLNLQWTILPYTHNRFSDPKNLKNGLKSIFSSVPSV